MFAAGNGDTLGLAARFFDRNCAGVLEGDDLEEIAFMTAPPISRASLISVVLSVPPCCQHPSGGTAAAATAAAEADAGKRWAAADRWRGRARAGLTAVTWRRITHVGLLHAAIRTSGVVWGLRLTAAAL